MCGIVGYVGTKPVVSVIINGLKKPSTGATIPLVWRSCGIDRYRFEGYPES